MWCVVVYVFYYFVKQKSAYEMRIGDWSADECSSEQMKAARGARLNENGLEVADLGPATADSVDYPDYGYRRAASIASGEARWGVALCGSGIGISIAVNRNPAARCALVSDNLSARQIGRAHV